MLRGCLGRFYSRAKGEEEGIEEYSRTKEQARMLLLHLLITALIAEDYSLGARQFEALRAALKLTPQDMVTHYKCALCLSTSLFSADSVCCFLEGLKASVAPQGVFLCNALECAALAHIQRLLQK